MAYKLSEIAEHIGAEVQGDPDCEITSVATLQSAKTGQISFLANSKYSKYLETTEASAVLVSKDALSLCQTNALVSDNPYLSYAKVAQLMDTTPVPEQGERGVGASIAEDAIVPTSASIGPNAVIESGVELGENVIIGAGSFIGQGTTIGANTRIWPNVTIYHNTVIGERCVIHSSTVIGADGFGWANDKGEWVKIPQLGRVVIGNNVDIGASTAIDRGALDDTVIADGVIIDNLVQIGHNVQIGEKTAIAGCTVFAGSSTIGKHCIIAGAAALNGHIDIADGTQISGMAMVTKSIKKPGVYSSGVPAEEHRGWVKNALRFKHLDSMNQKLKELEKEIRRLKEKEE